MVTKAHYAVIGDLHEVVPAINEEIRRRRPPLVEVRAQRASKPRPSVRE